MIEQITYVCEVCGQKYCNKDRCMGCENTPIKHSLGAKVGDKVRILSGDGEGDIATVEHIGILPPDWAPGYHHSECVEAKLDNSFGSRMLIHGTYELI